MANQQEVKKGDDVIVEPYDLDAVVLSVSKSKDEARLYIDERGVYTVRLCQIKILPQAA